MIEKKQQKKNPEISFSEKLSGNPRLNSYTSQLQSHRNKNHQKKCDRLIIGFHNHFCNSTQSSCTKPFNHAFYYFFLDLKKKMNFWGWVGNWFL